MKSCWKHITHGATYTASMKDMAIEGCTIRIRLQPHKKKSTRPEMRPHKPVVLKRPHDLDIYYSGPGLTKGALPALFYFALSAEGKPDSGPLQSACRFSCRSGCECIFIHIAWPWARFCKHPGHGCLGA